MKNYFLLFFAILLVNAYAQVAPPQAFSYSAVARDGFGNPLVSQNVGIQFGLLKGSTVGPIQYQENHFTTTNQFGLFTLILGTGAVQQGSFANINWGNDSYYLKVGLDANGGTNFAAMGTTQFLSVPYALYAGNANNNNDHDTSATNELQNLTITGHTLQISSGNQVVLPTINDHDTSSTNEIQTLSLVGDSLKLSQGNTIALHHDGDTSATNELQTISIGHDTVFLSNGGFVKLPASGVSGGKPYIVFSGNITNAQAATKFQQEFGYATQFIWILNTTQLTSISFAGLTDAVEIRIEGNKLLQTVSLPDLTTIYNRITVSTNSVFSTLNLPVIASVGGDIFVYGTSVTSLTMPVLAKVGGYLTFSNTSLTTLGLPALTSVKGFTVESTPLTTISLPQLVNIDSIFTVDSTSLTSLSLPVLTGGGAIYVSRTALTTLSMPLLTNVIYFIVLKASLTTLSLPALANAKEFQVVEVPITSLSLPLLANVGTFFVTGTNITTLSLPSLTTLGAGFECPFNKLTTTAVNNLLAKLVSLSPPITGLQINFLFQTPAAPPTGQGLINKQTLITNGNTVDTD